MLDTTVHATHNETNIGTKDQRLSIVRTNPESRIVWCEVGSPVFKTLTRPDPYDPGSVKYFDTEIANEEWRLAGDYYTRKAEVLQIQHDGEQAYIEYLSTPCEPHLKKERVQ